MVFSLNALISISKDKHRFSWYENLVFFVIFFCLFCDFVLMAPWPWRSSIAQQHSLVSHSLPCRMPRLGPSRSLDWDAKILLPMHLPWYRKMQTVKVVKLFCNIYKPIDVCCPKLICTHSSQISSALITVTNHLINGHLNFEHVSLDIEEMPDWMKGKASVY